MKSFLVLALSLALCATASADISEPKEDNPFTKIGRGIANVGGSVSHLIDSPYSMMETEGPTVAATRGLAQGVWRMGSDIALGVFDIVTFPIPVGPGFTYQTWKLPPFDSMVVSEYPPSDLTAYYLY